MQPSAAGTSVLNKRRSDDAEAQSWGKFELEGMIPYPGATIG